VLSCSNCYTQSAQSQKNFQNKNFIRNYSIGEYDKLWQAVSSGRGKGRTGKKKVAPKDVEGDFLGFGKANIEWPGLTKPIDLQRKPKQKRRDYEEYNAQFERRKRQFDATQRGWSGTTWPGRHAGAPELPSGDAVKDFDSIVIEVKKVAVTRANGKRKRTSALVVVGNGKGSIGWAIGKATFASAAIRKARNKAVNYLHYVPVSEEKSIYHNLQTKVNSTQINFEKKVPGHGRRCQRIVRAICELAGIENIRCKIVGRTTPLTVVRATFQGLQMQETHQELAERTGKYVVEFRNEEGNFPRIVAIPTEGAIQRRIEEETEHKQSEDITLHFDPYRGAHKPKSLNQIQGTHPNVLADASST